LTARSPAKPGKPDAGRGEGMFIEPSAAMRHAPSTHCHTLRRGAAAVGSVTPPIVSFALTWQLTTSASPTRVATRSLTLADAVLPAAQRSLPPHTPWSRAQLESLPGLALHDLMLLPVERLQRFMQSLQLPAPLDQATDLLLAEIRARLRYLGEVGLGYLTLDRQSRTLSGGEVQRINLTTALGTSLVNTLFVLDEPSIGLHPRDMGRVIGVMEKLRDAGNSLVVVEHDPQIMFAADRLLDMGPGPGELVLFRWRFHGSV
jgi:excinuclease ABC subunit A